ncbi:hypothetical protein BMR99_03690 [Propionibacterium freudenreichii]|nr:hypothetical protein BMR99_03690 [Propionibacterium freudenreichii]
MAVPFVEEPDLLEKTPEAAIAITATRAAMMTTTTVTMMMRLRRAAAASRSRAARSCSRRLADLAALDEAMVNLS